jgi:hypothetical protein
MTSRAVVTIAVGCTIAVLAYHALTRDGDRDDKVLGELSRLEQRIDRLAAGARSSVVACPAVSSSAPTSSPALEATVRDSPVVRGEREPTPESVAAATDARALIASSLARGTWTEGDREQLRRLVSSIAPEERDDVIFELVRGINAQKVRMLYAGPPI